ncbi:MAG: ankyrin repeat domain-containing protein [Oligoflexia bacterium]|nr:ankyrin repeat domain-containing protein [Oligoflexia bacterium]
MSNNKIFLYFVIIIIIILNIVYRANNIDLYASADPPDSLNNTFFEKSPYSKSPIRKGKDCTVVPESEIKIRNMPKTENQGESATCFAHASTTLLKHLYRDHIKKTQQTNPTTNLNSTSQITKEDKEDDISVLDFLAAINPDKIENNGGITAIELYKVGLKGKLETKHRDKFEELMYKNEFFENLSFDPNQTKNMKDLLCQLAKIDNPFAKSLTPAMLREILIASDDYEKGLKRVIRKKNSSLPEVYNLPKFNTHVLDYKNIPQKGILLKTVNDLIKRNIPVNINFCASEKRKLDNSLTDECEGHATVISGTRKVCCLKNKTNICHTEFMIQNSYGEASEKYNGWFKSDPFLLLKPRVTGITWIEECGEKPKPECLKYINSIDKEESVYLSFKTADRTTIKSVLQDKYNINIDDPKKISITEKEILKKLLNEVVTDTKRVSTLFNNAIANGADNILTKELIALGANVNAQKKNNSNNYDDPPLYYAIMFSQRTDIVQTLIDNKVDPCSDIDGSNILVKIFNNLKNGRHPNRPTMIDNLITLIKARWDSKTKENPSSEARLKECKLFDDYFLNNDFLLQTLTKAIEFNKENTYLDFIFETMSNRYDKEFAEKKIHSLLIQTITSKNKKILNPLIDLLINKNILLNILNLKNNDELHFSTMNWTPLMFAIKKESRNLSIIKTLLNAGADPNIGSATSTPLLMAIKDNDLETVKILLEKNARQSKVKSKSNTIYGDTEEIAIANKLGFTEITNILKENYNQSK